MLAQREALPPPDPLAFEVAKRDVRLAGAVIDVDETTGRARGIERLLVPDGGG